MHCGLPVCRFLTRSTSAHAVFPICSSESASALPSIPGSSDDMALSTAPGKHIGRRLLMCFVLWWQASGVALSVRVAERENAKIL